MSGDRQMPWKGLAEAWIEGLGDEDSLMNRLRLAPAEREAIFRERARRLARRPAVSAAEDSLEVIEFELGRQRYGVASRWVREVLPLTDLVPIPCTPAFVLGVTHIRGRLISVLDLKAFLGLPSHGITDLNRLMILRNNTLEIGVLADAIEEVILVPESSLAPPPDPDMAQGHLLGMTPDALLVLDGGRLLDDPRLIIRETVN